MIYSRIAQYIGKHAPRPIFNICLVLGIAYKKIMMHEQKKCFGEENPDVIFYVIRLFPLAAGYLCNYNYVLGYMKHAYDNGWVPVVDMENYKTMYSMDMSVHGTHNVWEYIFKQPIDISTGKRYTLEEVYRSKNVILSDGSEFFYNDSGDKDVLAWQHIMSERVPFADEVMEHVKVEYEKVLKTIEGEKIIGVPIRGTDLNKRVIGHPRQATPEELIEIITEKKKEWNMKFVFVNAEETNTIRIVSDNVEDVIYTDTKRIEKYDGKGNVAYANEAVNQYQAILDYVTNIFIISKCDAIIGTMNNGLYTALIWNNNRAEKKEIVDKGVFN